MLEDQFEEALPVRLPSGSLAYIQATSLGGSEQVGFHPPSFAELLGSVRDVAAAVAESVAEVPHKGVTLQFGLTIAVESGQVVAMIAKGTVQANFSVTLQLQS